MAPKKPASVFLSSMGVTERATSSAVDEELRDSAMRLEEELAEELASITAARAARVLAASAIAELARRYAPHKSEAGGRSGGAARAPTMEDLCAALFDEDGMERHRVLSRFRAYGMTGEEVIAKLIPAAARRLGELWVDDSIGFVDVTLGAARLQEAARANEPRGPDAQGPRDQPSILLCVPEGEDHTLGAFIAADRFRRAGFWVRLLVGCNPEEAAEAAAARPFAMIGLSAGSRRMVDPLAEAVRRIRDRLGDAPPIFIGGYIVDLEPQVHALVGADAAADVRMAISRLESTAPPVSYR